MEKLKIINITSCINLSYNRYIIYRFTSWINERYIYKTFLHLLHIYKHIAIPTFYLVLFVKFAFVLNLNLS
jgi:hypothetical protein